MTETTTDKITRKGTPPIKVYANPDEKRDIQELAKAHGLSNSEYLRNVGLGIPIVNILDKAKIADLAKLNADQGRLGGLLKLWLTNDEKLARYDQAKLINTIGKALDSIYENQQLLLEKVKKL